MFCICYYEGIKIIGKIDFEVIAKVEIWALLRKILLHLTH